MNRSLGCFESNDSKIDFEWGNHWVVTNISIEPRFVGSFIGGSISSRGIVELNIGIKTIDIVSMSRSEREFKLVKWGSVGKSVN